MWVVSNEEDLPHPGPCGHSARRGCLTQHVRHHLHVFRSKEAAKAWATWAYEIQPDEWIKGDPDGYFDSVIRVWLKEKKTIRQQIINVFTADLVPSEPALWEKPEG
jgi:hypothetical protein